MWPSVQLWLLEPILVHSVVQAREVPQRCLRLPTARTQAEAATAATTDAAATAHGGVEFAIGADRQ